jgi:hypothetical protein
MPLDDPTTQLASNMHRTRAGVLHGGSAQPKCMVPLVSYTEVGDGSVFLGLPGGGRRPPAGHNKHSQQWGEPDGSVL